MARAERGEQRTDPLQAANRALEAGDVAAARRLAAAVLAAPPTEEAAAEAREMLERTDVAWPVLAFGALAAVLLVALILLALLRSGHP
jgi:hypothetical protein